MSLINSEYYLINFGSDFDFADNFFRKNHLISFVEDPNIMSEYQDGRNEV